MHFFENYPPKNLEIRQFIRIFAENLAPRVRNPKQRPNTLVIITNKPKISLTELHKLDVEKASVGATDRIMILQGSERNSAVIVRLLCGNSAVRTGNLWGKYGKEC